MAPTRFSRRPRRPGTATVWGSLRPFVIVGVGLVVTLLLIALAFVLLTPSPKLRPDGHRFVVVNHSHLTMTNVVLTRHDPLADPPTLVIGTTSEIPNDGRWIIEHPQGDAARVSLAFDHEGRHHVFAHAAAMRANLGDVHDLTIAPGPRIRRTPPTTTTPLR